MTAASTPRPGHALRSALPATLCFIHLGRSWQREMETKKFLRLSRQDYGLFAAKICFKSQKLFRQFRGMEISQCPFANLPEARSGRWGQGLTAEKMKDCRWLSPALVGQFEFLEWTPDDHLRHTRFIGLREDKKPSDVTREPST